MMRTLIFPLTLLLLYACNIDETKTTMLPDPDFACILEYTPAPGQYVNDIQAGFGNVTTPEEACAYAERRLRANQYVSLGAWGGTVVAAFAQPVENDGGYNLFIQGNPLPTSSEPGIVWVMRDENRNGKPDDTWYELLGSEDANTVRNYEVTYRRPSDDGDPVSWSDNRGGSGTIDRTAEHPQAYWPAWTADESCSFRGSLLPQNVELAGNLWIAKPFAWGYADNYAPEGGSLFRIADAIDAAGEPVTLPSIDFVKIQTGVQDKGALIGEVSTEITAIRNYNLLK